MDSVQSALLLQRIGKLRKGGIGIPTSWIAALTCLSLELVFRPLNVHSGLRLSEGPRYARQDFH